MENTNTTSTPSDDEIIDLFIEGIMAEKHVDAPTEEIKQSVHNELKEQLLREIDRSLIAELPDDKLEELNRTAAATGKLDPATVAEAVEAANLDVTEIAGITMQRFRELYLGESATPSEVTPSEPTTSDGPATSQEAPAPEPQTKAEAEA